ncbi:MAG: hypothetical protein U0904_06245 [Candidatus Nanopelagicales bacterium]|nr:hypothetical protein [Candidatus Nanopelagicales bacterium]
MSSSDSEPGKPVTRHDIHVNPSQVRFDHWARIRGLTERLALHGGNAEELIPLIRHSLDVLEPWERYFAFPGPGTIEMVRDSLAAPDVDVLAAHMDRLETLLIELGDRAAILDDPFDLSSEVDDLLEEAVERHYFTVLVTESLSHRQMKEVRRALREARSREDEFVFELLPLASIEDALSAVVANPQVQAVWIRSDVKLRSDSPLEFFRREADLLAQMEQTSGLHMHGPLLGAAIRRLRPELDLYLTVDAEGQLPDPEDQALFNRVFYRREHPAEIHMATIDGVRRRYRTPFFDALKEYAKRPIGNFHALPIARGNSVFNSEWLQDMSDFYGEQIFMAETSSTVGGLDSLLSPTGTLREAQDAAARAFGAKATYFATNGTSTSNKIVVQAVCRPGDIVLIDRDCHKSHHYGLVMSGARPVYLDAYPLPDYAMYGAVSIRTIKEQLLALKRAGRLDAVRMLLLTNCTFDGIVYRPLRVMEEVLAIHPEMVFLWDEAWFAFAQLHPSYRSRTAMCSAARLRWTLDSREYRERYRAWKQEFDKLDPDDDSTWLDWPLMPDPDVAKVRVYATQSTHKSLSSLRQGSMIHEWDEEFASDVSDSFHEAYFTHTTTSPNYQILASLDLARRQVELEGYGKIASAMQMALVARDRVHADPLLNRYFRFLGPGDMIPEQFRPSGVTSYDHLAGFAGLAEVEQAFESDEFVLDPTRLTLYVGDTGLTGDEFKVSELMDRFGIQVNKTATNSVLFMTNIGTTWSSIDYLLLALREIARWLDTQRKESSPAEIKLWEGKVRHLQSELPPLPNFSEFHAAFRPNPSTPEGDIRAAFFLAYRGENHAYVHLDEALEQIRGGRQLVSSKFIIPYPPGFPILVPGQVISEEILVFIQELAIEEIHGYRADLGLPVFTDEALAQAAASASNRSG